MQTMIEAYENTRAGVQKRISELDHALQDDTMMHRDRERMKQRRDLLRFESIEMLHIITELRSRCA